MPPEKRSCVKFAKIILKIHTHYQLFYRQKVKYPFQNSKSHFIILYKPIVLSGCFPTMAFLWPDNTFKCSDIKENIVTLMYIAMTEMLNVSNKSNLWDKDFISVAFRKVLDKKLNDYYFYSNHCFNISLIRGHSHFLIYLYSYLFNIALPLSVLFFLLKKRFFYLTAWLSMAIF